VFEGRAEAEEAIRTLHGLVVRVAKGVAGQKEDGEFVFQLHTPRRAVSNSTGEDNEQQQETKEEQGGGQQQEQQKQEQQKQEHEDPPLHVQLKPLTKQRMLARLAAVAEDEGGHDHRSEQGGDPGCGGGEGSNGDDKDFISRAEVLARLLSLYTRRPRKHVPFAGVSAPSALTSALLQSLAVLEWPQEHHRPALSSQRYLVLQNYERHSNRRGKSNGDVAGITGTPTEDSTRHGHTNHELQLPQFQRLFGLAHELMLWADPAFAFTAIAVTKNLRGSPHIDSGDISYQYAISLGGFTTGGQLCVESEEPGGGKVMVVDTHNKVAKIDGRFVHWVRPFGGGDRYSLIFYATTGSPTPNRRAVYTDYRAHEPAATHNDAATRCTPMLPCVPSRPGPSRHQALLDISSVRAGVCLRMSRVNRAILWAEHAHQIVAEGGAEEGTVECGPTQQLREAMESLRAAVRLVGPATLYLGAKRYLQPVLLKAMQATLLALSDDSHNGSVRGAPAQVDQVGTRAVIAALQALKRGPGEPEEEEEVEVPKPTHSSKNFQVYDL
jgi:hypothetical protein